MATNITNSVTFGNTGHFATQPKFSKNIVFRLVDKFQSWREREAAMTELAAFSDRELADIGVARQEIASAVTYGRR